MSPAGFEPTMPASDRLQTHALDRSATSDGIINVGTSIRVMRMAQLVYQHATCWTDRGSNPADPGGHAIWGVGLVDYQEAHTT